MCYINILLTLTLTVEYAKNVTVICEQYSDNNREFLLSTFHIYFGKLTVLVQASNNHNVLVVIFS